MGVSFFPPCPIRKAQADPDKSGHPLPCRIIVRSALRVCPDLRGTLKPPVRGHDRKKDTPMLRVYVSSMYNPEAPFGLESLDLEALDRLMAERKRRGHLLKCIMGV